MPTHENPDTLAKCVADPNFAALHWESLIESVASNQEEELESATEALENCGELAASELPKLASQLEGTKVSALGSQRLYWICTLIGRFGNAANKVQSQVVKLACNPSIELHVRERAVWCLGELGPLHSTTRSALESQQNDAPERLKRLIEVALGAGATSG